MSTTFFNYFKRFALLLFVLVLRTGSFVQAQSADGTARLSYTTPVSQNGLRSAEVDLSWVVQKPGAFSDIVVGFDLTAHPDYTQYCYKGQIYTSTGEDGSMFREVKVTGFKVKVKVEGPGFNKVMVLDGVAGMGKGAFFGNSVLLMEPKTKEANNVKNWSITPLAVVELLWDGGWDLQQQIERKAAEVKKRNAFETAQSSGIAAGERNEWAGAIRAFQQAQSIGGTDEQAADLATKLARAQEQLRKKGVKKAYEDLVETAEDLERRGDAKEAKRIYEQAAATGHDQEGAARAAQRIDQQMAAQQKRLDDEAKALAAKTEEQARQRTQQQQKQSQEVAEKMRALRKVEEDAIAARHDSLKAAMDESQRLRWDELRAQKLQEEREQEATAEKEQEEKAKAEADKRNSKNDAEIAEAEEDMAYDAEKYTAALAEAQAGHRNALAIHPFDALELKREWWDNNPYVQVIADELYEDQRLSNEQNYAALIYKQHGAWYQAKHLYLAAIPYTDKDSWAHKNLVRQVEWCNLELELNELMGKNIYRDKNARRQSRENAKVLASLQRRNLNSQRVESAFLAYELNPNKFDSPGQYATQKWAMEQKLNQADAQYKQDAIITGVGQSVAVNAMFDEDKTANVAQHKSMLMNFYVGIGYYELPMLMNYTSDGFNPETKTSDVSVVPLLAQFDWWLFRSNHLDIGALAGASYGVNPSEGRTVSAFAWGAKGRLDFGFKRFKLANTVEFLERSATQTVDMDVTQANNSNPSAPGNRTAEGEFNYSVLRVGTGLKLDLSSSQESFILVQAFAEKPSFYPESLSKKPIFSYRIEAQFGLNISIGYAQNYAVAGIAKYPVSDLSNQNYLSFTLGKTWTLFDSAHP